VLVPSIVMPAARRASPSDLGRDRCDSGMGCPVFGSESRDSPGMIEVTMSYDGENWKL
jgi:hypothetical protein